MVVPPESTITAYKFLQMSTHVFSLSAVVVKEYTATSIAWNKYALSTRCGVSKDTNSGVPLAIEGPGRSMICSMVCSTKKVTGCTKRRVPDLWCRRHVHDRRNWWNTRFMRTTDNRCGRHVLDHWSLLVLQSDASTEKALLEQVWAPHGTSVGLGRRS